MFLLKLGDDDKPVLIRFLAGNIPSYAILSHTWEADDQEVTFKDLTDGVGINKSGHRKIQFCGMQARKDNLQYFWVDSCCIDKSSSAELQEAINSMFRWYRQADKCYVYLSDVSTGNPFRSSALDKSRWFTRGWTLQELLAPSSVEFFSREGKRLGDRKLLEAQLQHITGIPIQALQGTPLSEFSVDLRMSWAAKRVTTIEEDQAYCLLGIFNTNLPLIYGEGKENAFRRLRKEIRGFNGKCIFVLTSPHHDYNILTMNDLDDALSLLPYATDAPFNSLQRQHDPHCLNDTRVDLLQTIYYWADGQDERTIFWLNGLAGTGKSTIARTVAQRLFAKARLGASFFFSRGGGDVGHAGKFVTSIAWQLANSIPSFSEQVSNTLTERRDIGSLCLRDQWHQLVLLPLSKLGEGNFQSSYVLVVDALDECENDNDIGIIICCLAEVQSSESIQLRVFLTSRPEIPIRYGFGQLPDSRLRNVILHNISPATVNRDISVFFRYNLKLIGQKRSLDACWLSEEIITHLIQNAGGLFIWASTACRFIQEGLHADQRVRFLLEGSTSTTAPEEHLNKLYSTILRKSIRSVYSETEQEELYSMLRYLLGSIVVLSSPLSVFSLHRLLSVKKPDIDQVLEDLHAILDIPKVDINPVRLHHPSFRDFLLDNKRCEDPNFWVDEKQAHRLLFDQCLRLMSNSLKQDICDVNAPGTLVTGVKKRQIEQSLPPDLQYACLYWILHVEKSGDQLCDDGQVYRFLQVHLLYWLEALAWMGKIPEAIQAIDSMESLVSVSIPLECWSSFAHALLSQPIPQFLRTLSLI
jgi:hypothetical protein